MASSPGDLRVLVVADDLLSRAGLAALIAQQPGCAVVGQLSGGEGMTQALEVYQPDVVVWDMGWDASSALELLSDIQDARPPVVALLADESRAAETWASGARGLLLRSAGGEALLAALKAAAAGLVVIAPELVSPLLRGPDKAPDAPPMTSALTPREMQVLRLLGEGLSNKSIAFRLDISEHTVKFHLNSIMGKLGAQSRTEAVIIATRLGLVPL